LRQRETLHPTKKAELRRELARLELLMLQIAELEAECTAAIKLDEEGRPSPSQCAYSSRQSLLGAAPSFIMEVFTEASPTGAIGHLCRSGSGAMAKRFGRSGAGYIQSRRQFLFSG
jgi:hypothetical protein